MYTHTLFCHCLKKAFRSFARKICEILRLFARATCRSSRPHDRHHVRHSFMRVKVYSTLPLSNASVLLFAFFALEEVQSCAIVMLEAEKYLTRFCEEVSKGRAWQSVTSTWTVTRKNVQGFLYAFVFVNLWRTS